MAHGTPPPPVHDHMGSACRLGHFRHWKNPNATQQQNDRLRRHDGRNDATLIDARQTSGLQSQEQLFFISQPPNPSLSPNRTNGRV